MSTYPYVVVLDRRVCVTGVYNAGPNTTTWTLPYDASLIDAIVLSDDFGRDAGTVLTPTSVAGKVVTVAGADWSAGQAALGISFDASCTPTRPFGYDRNGAADPEARVTVRHLVAIYRDTCGLRIRSEMAMRQSRLVAAAHDEPSKGNLIGRFVGDASQQTLTIENTGPCPFTVVGLEWKFDYAPRD